MLIYQGKQISVCLNIQYEREKEIKLGKRKRCTHIYLSSGFVDMYISVCLYMCMYMCMVKVVHMITLLSCLNCTKPLVSPSHI